MAMIDYGAIAFKNGKLISTDMFTPMINMVGWEDDENDTYHDYDTNKDNPLKLNGNYFAYIGDKDCTIAFYKCQMVISQRYEGENRFSGEFELPIFDFCNEHIDHINFYRQVMKLLLSKNIRTNYSFYLPLILLYGLYLISSHILLMLSLI